MEIESGMQINDWRMDADLLLVSLTSLPGAKLMLNVVKDTNFWFKILKTKKNIHIFQEKYIKSLKKI